MLYPKINGIFKRDENGRFIDEFSMPEFEDLLDVEWRGTEKVDGTNVRIYINDVVTVRGRTDRASLSPFLLAEIRKLDIDNYSGLELFGEGFGGNIQNGAGYGDEVKFIMFDAVTPTKRYLTREEMMALQVELVYEYSPRTLAEWIDLFERGDYPQSTLREGAAEGVVLTPTNGYLDRYGHRIITKLKVKDFQ